MNITELDNSHSLTNRPFDNNSAHWYKRTGEPCYTIVGANGKERNTTLRDARKFLFVPSVTTVIQQQHREGLNLYKAEQLLLAGLTLPRFDDESERDWLRRVWIDSREHARQAAENGTALHNAIDAGFSGQEYDQKWKDHVTGVMQAIYDRFPGVPKWQSEVSSSHHFGFGGKTDLLFSDGQEGGIIVDFKTKQSFSSQLSLYDEHLQQLAAYSMLFGVPEATCAICYCSIDQPGQTKILVADPIELFRGWKMFKALLRFWQAKNKYDSGWEKGEDT